MLTVLLLGQKAISEAEKIKKEPGEKGKRKRTGIISIPGVAGDGLGEGNDAILGGNGGPSNRGHVLQTKKANTKEL